MDTRLRLYDVQRLYVTRTIQSGARPRSKPLRSRAMGLYLEEIGISRRCAYVE
jgi:hypothetical protein